MSYQLLHVAGMERQEVVTISPHGEIKTVTVNGHAVVLVTAHEEDMGLNQTVSVHVEVSCNCCTDGSTLRITCMKWKV